MLCRPLRVWSVPPPELSGWCANLLHGGGLMVTSLLNQASQRMVTCFWWDPCAVYRARLDALPLLRLPFCSLQRPEGVAYFLELILYLFLAIGQIAHDWKLSLVSACRPLLESFQHWYKTIEWKPLSLQLCSASSMREGGHRAGATRQAQLGLVTWARRAPRSQRSEEPSAHDRVLMCPVTSQIQMLPQRVCLLSKLTWRPRGRSTGLRTTVQWPTSEDVGQGAVEGSTVVWEFYWRHTSHCLLEVRWSRCHGLVTLLLNALEEICRHESLFLPFLLENISSSPWNWASLC